ncbi:MAG: hypothetical protein WHS38_07725 [Thermodesulforhabdaceae bacterium]
MSILVTFVLMLPFRSLGGEVCEDRNDEIVCRSGPSNEDVELNRLRSLTREERAWEMLQSMDVKIKLKLEKPHGETLRK